MVLMRTDPFRELDRLSQQLLGTPARPTLMPMDAWREGDSFVVEFDLPGVEADSIDLDVERNVLTVRAERPERPGSTELLAAERRPSRENHPGLPIVLRAYREFGPTAFRSAPFPAKCRRKRPRRVVIPTRITVEFIFLQALGRD